MQIDYTPQRTDDTVSVSYNGDVLQVNGVDYDFSSLGEGEYLPCEEVGCPYLVSDVRRLDGSIQLTLIQPVGPPQRQSRATDPAAPTVVVRQLPALPPNATTAELIALLQDSGHMARPQED